MGPINLKICKAYFLLYLLLMAFATASSTMLTEYEVFVYVNLPEWEVGRSVRDVLKVINERAEHYEGVLYTFDGLWYLSGIFVAVFAIYVFRSMRKVSATDKVSYRTVCAF